MNAGLEVPVYVMFINKLAFLASVRKRRRFTTIEYITNRSEKELARSANKIIGFYLKKASQSILCIWTLNLTFRRN